MGLVGLGTLILGGSQLQFVHKAIIKEQDGWYSVGKLHTIIELTRDSYYLTLVGIVATGLSIIYLSLFHYNFL